MDSREGLFPDNLCFESFKKCAEIEHDMKGIRELWERISITCSMFLQVRHHHRRWISLGEAFVRKWGIDYVPVDIESSFDEVEKEPPIFDVQCNECYLDMEEISNHHEWIRSLNYPFPRVPSYHNYWIPRVEAFMQKWSSDYVPADIKSSLAEVKELYPIDR